MMRGRPELSNFSSGKGLVTERFEPLRAGDFVLRATSVSPLDHAKGRRALDPVKNACAFFRKKIICKAHYNSCRTFSPAAVRLRKPAAGGGNFRAVRDQRFAAGSRQGPEGP